MAAAILVAASLAASARAQGLVAFSVEGDAITRPLGDLDGDASRGLTIVRDRRVGNCLICHAAPIAEEPFQGEIGPRLHGVGARLTPAQIRLRLVDQSILNAETLMPPYYRVHGLNDVAPEYRGRPALSAQQIEDIVEYLSGLRE
ncbi:MAG: sulfur oxidation c-type cytochrome SoxX [Chitinophagales bacterium]|nr:sulfur oxidation c-type cytochrome SoxX [Hyphomicrobiales bacterium]